MKNKQRKIRMRIYQRFSYLCKCKQMYENEQRRLTETLFVPRCTRAYNTLNFEYILQTHRTLLTTVSGTESNATCDSLLKHGER
jgi:hypothetical protein